MARHLKNIPHQIGNTSRASLDARGGAMFAELHRSLGWRMLAMEGYLRREQATYLCKFLASNPSVRSVLEIGFNAGHSSYVFLDARPDVRVVSFDLGQHSYVSAAKDFIDKRFSGRHEIVIGDSRTTVPGYGAKYPGTSFDLAFVDGGHDYEVASADLRNCRALARGAFVIMDDLLSWKSWGIGPAKAWREACHDGLVTEMQLIQDGRPVEYVRRKAATAAWGIGRYS